MNNDIAANNELPGTGIGQGVDEGSSLGSSDRQFATMFPMLQQMHLQQQHMHHNQREQLHTPTQLGMGPLMPSPPAQVQGVTAFDKFSAVLSAEDVLHSDIQVILGNVEKLPDVL